MKKISKKWFRTIEEKLWGTALVVSGALCATSFASNGEVAAGPDGAAKADTTAAMTVWVPEEPAEKAEADSAAVFKDSIERMKSDLVAEVADYIESVAPDSRMSAENIVRQCIEEDFDITLLLSQGHLETHFATAGRSNNCFGLGGRRYRHPDRSVADYIELMKTRYVSERTTEQALRSNMKLENGSGHYSSSADYGRRVSEIRKNIIRTTGIKRLFDRICAARTVLIAMN